MTTRIQNRRMETAGAIPALTEILEGELVLNLPDKKLFTRDASNNVLELTKPPTMGDFVQAALTDDDFDNIFPPSGQPPGFSLLNGWTVLIDAGVNGTIYGGLWSVNVSGEWIRASGWEVGARIPKGTIIFYPRQYDCIIYMTEVEQVIGQSDFVVLERYRIESDSVLANETAPVQKRFVELKSTLQYKFSDNQKPTPLVLGNLDALFEAKSDCISTTNTNEFTYTTSGTGAAFSSLAIGADDAVGILRWTSGTVATNRCSIASPNFSIIRLSKGLARFVARHRLPVLSDATNTYTTRIGFIDSVAAESADGVFFRYSHGVNAGEWQAVTRANNVETAVDTNVLLAANTWKRFSIEVNPAGTEAKFYLDDSLVATITTNIPIASGRELGYGVFTLRTVGTASINMADTDYVQVQQVFTTRR